jgi:Kef-type K+ transport system membrane component KefB
VPEVSFGNLLVVAVVAMSAPLLVGLVPAIRVPAVVLEILAGIVLGPAVLGWVEVDLPVSILALLGLAFLLFLAGLEIDVAALRGRVLRVAGLGFGATVVLGVAVGLVFSALDYVQSPLLLAVALSATSLGLVVPVLKDAGQVDKPLGQLTIAGSTVADFGAIVLLSLLFSEMAASVGSTLLLLGLFAALAVATGLAFAQLNRSMRLDTVLVRLQDTTAEIRVRIAVVLLVGFVALAGRLGLETILGAFLAGAILSMVDRDTMDHPHFRLKLEAIGYGFVVPVFFVASGLRFDLEALLDTPSAALKVPLFLLALLVVRGVPAALYVPDVGRRGAVAAALLQATSLPFLVTATQIGLELGEIRPDTAAALVSAGLLSVVLFPLLALTLLQRGSREAEAAAVPGS